MEEIIITDYFQRGCPVKTQLLNSINWIPNVIFDTYSKSDEIGVIFDDRYSDYVIFVGDTIKLNYIDGDVQYYFDTCVTSIRLEAMQIMTLKIISMKQTPNRRKYERYSVNYGANILSYDNPKDIFCVVTNISLSGLGFIARRNFFVGDIIDISILLPSGSFVIEAEVVRSNNTVKGMEYGVHFTRQDELMQKEISELIENIKEREDRLSHIAGMSVM